MPPFNSPAATRRAFSLFTRLRSTIRAVEPHLFERYPAHGSIARPDWGKQARHVGETAIFFFPAAALLLGWPLLAKKAIDGRV